MTAEKKELYKLLLLPQSLLFLVSSSLDFPLQPHIKRRDGIWGIFVVAILKISPKRSHIIFFLKSPLQVDLCEIRIYQKLRVEVLWTKT